MIGTTWADREEKELPPKGFLIFEGTIGFSLLGWFFNVLILGLIFGVVLGGILEVYRHREVKVIRRRYQESLVWKDWLYPRRKKKK